MPPVTLEGDTLGDKRRHYNKLVEDAVANKQYELCDISGDDSDIDNLLKIDIASRNRNVHFGHSSNQRRSESRNRSRSRSQNRTVDSECRDNRKRNSSSVEHSSKSDSGRCKMKLSTRDFITMAPKKLKKDTLGQKHQNCKKLVEDAVANKQYELCDISGDDSDIDNLLKIDIASRNRNVHYIIEVMKSKDMLYAATAIKKSTWLITEQQYANIINPEYLHTQLLPSMNTKTFNKLMLHIRLNLKDETRVETFYEYLKDTDSGYKWLQNCSIPFIENVIKNERLVPLRLFKRLCKRSAHFLRYYTKVETRSIRDVKNEILFLLKSNTKDVLNVLEDETNDYFPKMGKKKTEILMKTCPQRVLDDFNKYADIIDLSVLAKYLNKNEIKSFLYKQASRLRPRLYDHDTLRHFIKNMPKEDRFEFVKNTFINKSEMSLLFSEDERLIIESKINPYQWYEFAPDFYYALHEIKRLMHTIANSPAQRCSMLIVLISCTQENPVYIKALLEFVNDCHINEPFIFKIQFVNNLISQVSTHKFDVESWNLLDQLFHSMEVYTESDKNVQMCLESIVLYKLLHHEPIPEIVEQKMTLNPFNKLQRRLNQVENNIIFTYLLNFMFAKVQSENISNEHEFSETVGQLKNVLTFIRGWKKDISKYPNVLAEIRKLVKIKQENMWKTDMSCLYNVKKSWRKHMFEESLSLCLSEEACLNALKHKPQLLTRHDKDIDTLRTNDAVSLRRLLAKLRVYWSHSLARDWTDAYLLNLNKPTGQKATIEGLFLLLTQNQITDMAKQYAPYDFKINWRCNKTEIGKRTNIAKKLHLARPLIHLDTVLLYARGNYFQHAAPSLNAVLYNMSEVESLEHLPKLLDAPVSLQKFGLHLVSSKLKTDDLKTIYSEVWDRTYNHSLRLILFLHTYERMCKVKDPTVVKELWELLRTFFKLVFIGRLGHVELVPASVRSEYFMESYVYITGLPRTANFESFTDDLIKYSPKIMVALERDFVVDTMLSPADVKFCSYKSQFTEMFACFVLCGKRQEDQLQRYRDVVDPVIDKAFQMWDNMHSGEYYVKDNFENFLRFLVWHFRVYMTLNKIPIPASLFVEIKTKIENGFYALDNYVLFTSFKLITEYVKLMDDEGCASIALECHKFSKSEFRHGRMPSAMENVWKHIHIKISPSLGPIIVKCLKEDTEQYSPTIHNLFAEALEVMFLTFAFQNKDMFVLETLKYMLDDNDFIPSYLVVSKVTPKYCNNDELKCIQLEIRKKLMSHPSRTVQVHYRNDFRIF